MNVVYMHTIIKELGLYEHPSKLQVLFQIISDSARHKKDETDTRAYTQRHSIIIRLPTNSR